MIRHTIAGIELMPTPLDPAVKKAYEVSYALFRVAAILPSRSFAEILEKEALNLLHATVGNFSAEAQNSLGIIHYLVSFGKDTNNIDPENSNLLVQQLESLASLLHDRARNTITPADLSQIFSATEPVEPRVAGSPSAGTIQETRSLPKPRRASGTSPVSAAVILLSDRQSIILDKIRQSGNCRTRDIQAALPGLSERTLRYDLQRLVEEGKIERVGGGGPASFYRLKEGSPPSNISGSSSL